MLRPDLQILPSDAARGGQWVVKDPLRLTYFRAPAEEIAFLSLLDGKTTLSEMVRALQQRFPESRFSIPNLVQFLSAAIHGGLLRSTECGFGVWVSAVSDRRRSGRLKRKLLSLLVHRVRGIDPTRLLQSLYPLLSWIYRPGVAAVAAVFIAIVAMGVGVRLQQIESELPELIRSLMTVQNLPYIVASIIIVKILHEFGHALTCHHFKGECHELGFLIVGFLPLLYCDVSDTWSQRNRWSRMLVAAAGIITELFLAAVFGALWLFTLPGTLHYFCLNAMVVCSVNTLLVNGNPLLRYDGYYVLSDLIRMPNLSAEARSVFVGWFNRVVFGSPMMPTITSRPLSTLAIGLFGLCSTLYRLAMVALILFGVHQVLSSVGLEAMSAVLVVSAVLGQFFAAAGVVRTAGRNAPGRGRFMVGMGVLATLGVVLLIVPLPRTVSAPFVITPGVALPIYAGASGYLEPHVRYGQHVSVNTPVATLRNPDLEVQLVQCEGDLAVHEARLTSLLSRRGTGGASGSAIPASQKAVQSCRERLKTIKKQAAVLSMTSPVAGVVFPPRNRIGHELDAAQRDSWVGYPFDPVNRGVWQDAQTLLCWIGPESDLRASVVVMQSDIELISELSEVTLTFHSHPARSRTGRVASRSAAPESRVARELAARQLVALDSSTPDQPAEKVYSVQVRLTDDLKAPPVYATGFARIRCQPASLASRLWRYARHTFAFRL